MYQKAKKLKTILSFFFDLIDKISVIESTLILKRFSPSPFECADISAN